LIAIAIGIAVSDFLGGDNSGANDNDRDLSYLESVIVSGKELARGSGSSGDPGRADSSPAPRGRYAGGTREVRGGRGGEERRGEERRGGESAVAII